MTDKLLIIDGMALLFRHFYATSFRNQFMRNSEGIPTNAIQGFVRHVYTAINDIQPTHVAICWDMGQATFRNDMFNAYKQHRPEPPEELIPQFDDVKEIAAELGFLNLGVKNYEADDVIGTLVKQFSEEMPVYVVTGDRDILQCLNKNTEIWLTKKGFSTYNRYTEAQFEEEYGLHPEQLIDVKAFMGDSADGYPGVKGIGEKTAIKLVQQHGSVEEVVAHLDELTPAQQKKIQADYDNLILSKQLARIYTEVPLETNNLKEQMAYQAELSHILSVCNEKELYVSAKYLVTHYK
ncbi:5'-3' exonuclease [Staphylococcus auricularis]|uniref:5'-3' exonuclease n=1 Tax=Staphylococcus auricularis TaxID=29379 RepID=A0AAP8TTW0_9STAP|nr:5'-3' exonuclease [Staphylococcus auricularis]MDC6326689.1 5'-3' exonuclease [Staphylococcus auricularis]MDN4532566.1 5'-3' exonuclease [Staphylococcus auricularis]PNZ68959.1 5'-3' exonuclease [Staphylococcus auricularis]QPT05319.1 5'-3' exonuclease [Staphylococcus auricularis]SQJ11689.1 5'-3' exonuclease [Staphylococcus auricularis]